MFDEARGAEDSEVLRKAHAENWILITNDKDFGEKVYRERCAHCGVVLLRLEDERTACKIEALRRLLDSYAARLAGRFVVVTETRVRFGRQQA